MRRRVSSNGWPVLSCFVVVGRAAVRVKRLMAAVKSDARSILTFHLLFNDSLGIPSYNVALYRLRWWSLRYCCDAVNYNYVCRAATKTLLD